VIELLDVGKKFYSVQQNLINLQGRRLAAQKFLKITLVL
jgi:hypothetical protein